jgi:hypothetical protein
MVHVGVHLDKRSSRIAILTADGEVVPPQRLPRYRAAPEILWRFAQRPHGPRSAAGWRRTKRLALEIPSRIRADYGKRWQYRRHATGGAERRADLPSGAVATGRSEPGQRDSRAARYARSQPGLPALR